MRKLWVIQKFVLFYIGYKGDIFIASPQANTDRYLNDLIWLVNPMLWCSTGKENTPADEKYACS